MKKDCFYVGLKEHNKYLVSHMKDRDQYGPAQMLKEIREQEDSRYPVNTMPKPLLARITTIKIQPTMVQKVHTMTRAKLMPLGIQTYIMRTRSKKDPARPRLASSTPV